MFEAKLAYVKSNLKRVVGESAAMPENLKNAGRLENAGRPEKEAPPRRRFRVGLCL